MGRGLAAVAAAILASTPLAAHEEGVIRLGSPTASPGQEIEIRGERLPRATMLRLELRGALASHPLGEIRSDAAGRFTARFALPAEVARGRYRVLAFAPDGDEVARADLEVIAAPPQEIAPAGPAAHVHATDAMMDLPVRRTTGEWAVIVVLVAAAALGGAALLRGAQQTRSERSVR